MFRRASLALFSCCLGIGGPVVGAPLSLANQTATIVPMDDTHVSSAFPGTNYGALDYAVVDPDNFVPPIHVYLRFDLGSIPGDATILEATLTMTAFNGWAFGGDGTVYVQFVADDAWSEATMTWNTRPAAGAVLGSWWLWYNNVPVDQIGQTSTAALAAAVQSEVSGDGALSVRLSSPGYRTLYRTGEYSNASQRPLLTVRYSQTSGVGTPEGGHGLRLLECVPNPMSSHGVLNFELPVSGHVNVEVFDVMGRSVATLVDGPLSVGTHAAPWDRRSTSGLRAPAGVYFARLSLAGRSISRRFVVVD